ncbi:hypothetical protein L1049_019725 [Liquidambar formosana]|uniref:PGG domain-containing protein n=1 Tax=Liquidambar formosana TaxID=63359 RepID=A0AAP0XAC6_LIQFO
MELEIMHMGSTSTNGDEPKITGLDPKLYKAAAKGDDINAIEDKREHLHLLLTPNKNTVLHIHITAQCDEKIESTEFLEKILKLRPSLLLQVNDKGETPLHIAARYGLHKTVDVLTKHAKDLHEEGLEGGVGAAKQLLRMTNNEGDTALHEAVRFNHGKVVELLTGEDPDLLCCGNDVGETPLYLAAERGLTELVSKILDKFPSPAHGGIGGPIGRTALHAAVILNDFEMTTNILWKMRVLSNEADKQGWTPLHYAAYLGHARIVTELLEDDASVAPYTADAVGKRTALHLAAVRGHSEIVKEIIERFPDCSEMVDDRGRNVLHFAIESRDENTVKVITKNPWLTNLLNDKDKNEGSTPLHRLAICNSFKSAAALLGNPRVDKMAFNKQNQSALDIILANDANKIDIKDFEKSGPREGGRNITYKDGDGGRANEKLSTDGGERGNKEDSSDITNVKKEDRNEERISITKLKKTGESHLIVATLIATVTFAAGFTLPGGYVGDEGPGQGAAILTRKAAFKAFVIADTIAMELSITAVFIHLILALPLIKEEDFYTYFMTATATTLCATGAMVVAFMTGLYAVLEHSSGLAIATCVIASLFTFTYIKGGFEILKQLLQILRVWVRELLKASANLGIKTMEGGEVRNA